MPETSSPMESGDSAKRTIRIHGQLHSIKTLLDPSGNVIERLVTPLMVEFGWRDVVQLVVGACVLGIPVAFTEEVWILGQELPPSKTIGIVLLSLVALSLFGYFNFYKDNLRGHEFELVKRVVAAYVVTFCMAAILLTLFEKCPWATDPPTALTRVVLVAFPACFSATVVDSLS